MLRYTSAERLVLLRNIGYGGAAVCLIMLLQMAQVGARDLSLRISAIALSIGMPFWFLLGATVELYIFLGKESYPRFRAAFAKTCIGWFSLLAGTSLTVAIGGLTWYIMPEAGWAFVVTSLVCFGAFQVFDVILARWWFGPDGPASRERDDKG